MSTISFSNTQNAFESKTDADLKRAYWLFKVINNNFLVRVGPVLTTLAMKLMLPVKPLIRATIFKHFCGGETIKECHQTIEQLARFNVGSILDYSVEGEEKETVFDATCNEIINTILHAKGDNKIPFCVFKVTGIGRFGLLEKVSARGFLSEREDAELLKLKHRVNEICKAAYESDVRLFIDAEESWIQLAIDSIADEMMMEYNRQKAIVYNTIQFYRTGRIAYLKDSISHARNNKYYAGYKLVRGAYMEKERARAKKYKYPSPIQPDKESCDREYNEGLKICIEHIDTVSICAGTHNEQSSLLLAELMQQKNISPSNENIWFSQLLGMSDHISFNLAKAGYNVCKYVPYGPVVSVLPYLFRRAAENTSISGQMGRELSLIIEERKRREK